MATGYVPGVQKIAVLRANALGDFIFSLPALAALRATYPTAKIVLLALSWHTIFLAGRPSPVDRVVVIPPCRGVSLPDDQAGDENALEPFFRSMREEEFDLACQFHGGGRYSNPFLSRLGARLTIGSKTPDAIALDRWLPYRYFQQESIRYLEIASLVGATPVELEPHLTVTRRDEAELERIFFLDERPLVVLHPGASDRSRRWPSEKFAQVGDILAAWGARVVIVGAEAEQEAIAEVEQTMRSRAENLCGRLSLGALAALLARSRVVIGNDSGPLHLAQAVGARTVGLYWCLNLPTVAPLLRRDHCPLVSWQLTCPTCGCNRVHHRCMHHGSLLDSISAEEVITAAQEMLTRPACTYGDLKASPLVVGTDI